ncbi:MAG TPA: sulfurtransferase TusA family protein [Polyangiaceae bacterium]
MQSVDARGKSCPLPIVLVSQAVRAAAPGAKVMIRADDRAFPEDIRAWCKKTGNELLSLESHEGFFEARVRKP